MKKLILTATLITMSHQIQADGLLSSLSKMANAVTTPINKGDIQHTEFNGNVYAILENNDELHPLGGVYLMCKPTSNVTVAAGVDVNMGIITRNVNAMNMKLDNKKYLSVMHDRSFLLDVYSKDYNGSNEGIKALSVNKLSKNSNYAFTQFTSGNVLSIEGEALLYSGNRKNGSVKFQAINAIPAIQELKQACADISVAKNEAESEALKLANEQALKEEKVRRNSAIEEQMRIAEAKKRQAELDHEIAMLRMKQETAQAKVDHENALKQAELDAIRAKEQRKVDLAEAKRQESLRKHYHTQQQTKEKNRLENAKDNSISMKEFIELVKNNEITKGKRIWVDDDSDLTVDVQIDKDTYITYGNYPIVITSKKQLFNGDSVIKTGNYFIYSGLSNYLGTQWFKLKALD